MIRVGPDTAEERLLQNVWLLAHVSYFRAGHEHVLCYVSSCGHLMPLVFEVSEVL